MPFAQEKMFRSSMATTILLIRCCLGTLKNEIEISKLRNVAEAPPDSAFDTRELLKILRILKIRCGCAPSNSPASLSLLGNMPINA